MLDDEAQEDALYDRQTMRDLIGIELGQENVPDATTLLKFRGLLE
jgi:transposase, IS5 family